MRLITRRELADTALSRWEEICDPDRPDQAAVLDGLRALGRRPEPDAVDRVFGNTSWTWLTCCECGNVVATAASVGREDDVELSAALLCLDCCRQALAMFPEENP